MCLLEAIGRSGRLHARVDGCLHANQGGASRDHVDRNVGERVGGRVRDDWSIVRVVSFTSGRHTLAKLSTRQRKRKTHSGQETYPQRGDEHGIRHVRMRCHAELELRAGKIGDDRHVACDVATHATIAVIHAGGERWLDREVDEADSDWQVNDDIHLTTVIDASILDNRIQEQRVATRRNNGRAKGHLHAEIAGQNGGKLHGERVVRRHDIVAVRANFEDVGEVVRRGVHNGAHARRHHGIDLNGHVRAWRECADFADVGAGADTGAGRQSGGRGTEGNEAVAVVNHNVERRGHVERHILHKAREADRVANQRNRVRCGNEPLHTQVHFVVDRDERLRGAAQGIKLISSGSENPSAIRHIWRDRANRKGDRSVEVRADRMRRAQALNGRAGNFGTGHTGGRGVAVHSDASRGGERHPVLHVIGDGCASVVHPEFDREGGVNGKDRRGGCRGNAAR